MGNLKEMRGKLNSLATEMSALHKKGSERTEDEESRFDAVIAEFNDLGPEVQKREAQEATVAQAAAMRQGTGSAARSIGDGAAVGESEERDLRSIGQRFAASDAVKNYRGKGRSDVMELGSFNTRHAAEFKAGDDPVEQRALVYTDALPTGYLEPQRVAGIFPGVDIQGSLRDVLINGTTTSNSISYFRELLFTNSAAAVAQASATTGSTGLKPESAITFEPATAPVVTIAHWIPITRQTLEDANEIRAYVEQRLITGLKLEESDQLLNGAGTGANMTGILNTSGVQDLDNTATTGYWAVNPVEGAGAANENFNRILRAKTLVRTVGGGLANFVTVNPADLENMLAVTNTAGNYYSSGPFGGAALGSLWGLTVVEDGNIAAGTALVGDGRMAAVWDRMQAQILIDTIDDQFVRNMMTLLAEERLALTVFRPKAFAIVELAA